MLALKKFGKTITSSFRLTKNDVLLCNGGVNDVYNNNWKKIISQIMKFFQYNDNANIKMLDILHRYDLSDNSCE